MLHPGLDGDEPRRSPGFAPQSLHIFFASPACQRRRAAGAQAYRSRRCAHRRRQDHVYGTPFFIDASLPIESRPVTPFRRLMIAQDANRHRQAGAGRPLLGRDDAGRIAGRIRHPAAA